MRQKILIAPTGARTYFLKLEVFKDAIKPMQLHIYKDSIQTETR